MSKLSSEILRVTRGDTEAVIRFGTALARRDAVALESLLRTHGVEFESDAVAELLDHVSRAEVRVFACA